MKLILLTTVTVFVESLPPVNVESAIASPASLTLTWEQAPASEATAWRVHTAPTGTDNWTTHPDITEADAKQVREMKP